MKVRKSLLMASIGAALALAQGCVSKTEVAFIKRGQAGLYIETYPPDMRFGLSRTEQVIAPSFQGGATPPLIGAFRSGVPSAGFKGSSQTLVAGKAAIALARERPEPDAAAGHPEEPAFERKLTPLEVTDDTILGLKLRWPVRSRGVGGGIKLGYQKSSLVSAPTLLHTNAGRLEVGVISIIATMDDGRITTPGGRKRLRERFYATGNAALANALRPSVREELELRLAPELDGITLAEQRHAAKVQAAKQQEVKQAELDRIIGAISEFVAPKPKREILSDKLDELRRGTGLHSSWVRRWTGKDASELEVELRGLDETIVKSMGNNLPH